MKKIYLFLSLIIISSSCTKLDEEVFDKIPESNFPENESQSALVIVPTYNELADLIDDAGWWFWAQEVTSDEVVFPVRLTDWEDGGKWRVLHEHLWNNNTDAVNSMWSHMYDGVFEANKAIDELTPFEAEESAQLTIAKLKVLRAFYFYLLIDNYGDVPYVTSFFDAPEQPEKDARAFIYDQIVQEVVDNKHLLPLSANNFAVTKGMAHMLLAKLYINSEVYTGVARWSEAEAVLDSVISSGVYSLEAHPLDPFKAQNEASFENIFTIPFDESNLTGFRLHMRTLHYLHNQTYDMPVGTWNGFAIVKDHYDSYEDIDLRKEGFLVGPQFTSGGQALYDEVAETELVINPVIPALVMDASYTFDQIRNSGARVVKYEVESGAMESLNNDFPLFRYADALLMKAECQIRLGGNGDEWVNQVRSRAGVASWAAVDLEMLLEERGRELFCEGHRRQDLIRFDKFGESWWEKAESEPDRTIFPIPQWAIDANPNLGE